MTVDPCGAIIVALPVELVEPVVPVEPVEPVAPRGVMMVEPGGTTTLVLSVVVACGGNVCAPTGGTIITPGVVVVLEDVGGIAVTGGAAYRGATI